MAIRKRIKNLSKLTRELLAEGESVRSDFKRLPDGINADDLVAFANSEFGGSILTGVDEQVVDKAQIGIVLGCDVSDASILQILNKAVSCFPPVSIDIYIENLDDKPILRVEIPSSKTKPHCTPKGIYCRRDGARNRPLHPSELLRLFLESEASAFAARFEVAAGRITGELSNLESSLGDRIKSMSDQLGWADLQLGDTESTLTTIQGLVANMTVESASVNSRLRAMFRQDAREDPIRTKARTKYLNRLIKDIRGNKKHFEHVVAGGQLLVQSRLPEDGDITDEDAKHLMQVAVRHVHDAERDKKYQIVVKSPDDCREVELDNFVSKVAEGGEVAGGVRERAKRAAKLGFIVFEDGLVGTAALKKPNSAYRAKVFKNACSLLNPSDFPYELGWIFLDANHRRKGQMTRLMNELLPSINGSALYATTRTSNEIMREMLNQLKFTENGDEYKSKNNPEDTIKLYIRNAVEVDKTK